jgi:hypothetical protein
VGNPRPTFRGSNYYGSITFWLRQQVRKQQITKKALSFFHGYSDKIGDKGGRYMEILLGILVIIGSGLAIAHMPKPKLIPVRSSSKKSQSSNRSRSI